jgi:prolipoprotein diacylglyceryltransferase
MLLAGSRVGAVSSLVMVALYLVWRQLGFPDAHPIRNGAMFAEIGFLIGTFAGVLRHGGHAETPRIAAHNAALGFIFGGILTGLLYLLRFAAPDLDGMDFLRFLAFCTFGGLVFALGGGFIGAVLSVLIPVDHPLRRRPTPF